MSTNVEILGGSLMVQHYIEEIGQPDHLRLVSTSDVFTPTGRTKIGVIWDLSVKKIDDETCATVIGPCNDESSVNVDNGNQALIPREES